MYIRIDLLARELRKKPGIGVQAYNLTERIVKEIRMFPVNFDASSGSLDQDVCYVCDFRKLRFYDPHLELAPLICVVEPGAVAESTFFMGRVVIAVNGISVSDLMVELIRIAYTFGSLSSPTSENSHELLRCTGIKELLEKGREFLGNPVILTDEKQEIVAYADSGNVSEEPYRKIIEMGRLPVGHLWAYEGKPEDLGRDDHPFINEGTGTLPTVMCKRLRIGSRVLGYLHLFQFNREFAEEDGPLFDLLGSLLALEMDNRPRRHAGMNEEEQIEKFLQDCLNNPRSVEYMAEGQKKVGLTLKPFVYAIVLYARKSSSYLPISYYDISKRMAELLPDCFGFLYRNSILLLLSANDMIEDFPAFLTPIKPLVEKSNLIVGISDPFPNLERLRANCFQACKALQLGPAINPTEDIFLYRDYSVYYMVELALKSDDMMAFCMPEIIKLMEHSKKDGGDLLNTLRIYLRCGRSKSQTAREMFVHLNTVKYRLQQIQSILGLDFDNDDNALKLMLSFKMLEYREKFQNYEPIILPPDNN